MFGIFKKSKATAKPSEMSEDSRRLTVQAMAAMAAADGDIGPSERASINEIYTQMTGLTVDADSIGAMAYPFLKGNISIGSVLESNRDALSASDKAIILKSCYLVLLADGVEDEGELAKMQEIEAGLGYSADQTEEILADLKKNK